MKREAHTHEKNWLYMDEEGTEARAQRRAERQVKRMLARGCDLVPCPHCGQYQAEMAKKARRVHRKWMLNTGAVLLFTIIPVGMIGTAVNTALESRNRPFLPWWLFATLLVLLAVVGVAFIVAKYWLTSKYDPNNDVERSERRRIAKWTAIYGERYERLRQAWADGSLPPPSEPIPSSDPPPAPDR